MDHALTDIVLERYEDLALSPEESIKVRPFNLARTVNLRDLDPSDIDQLISVKGLLIRSSPVIPDLKTGFLFN
jgi:DNA replication licensing factor MCM4